MQDNLSLFRTQTRGPLLSRNETVPVRRIVLRGDRNYLRALRAAEMAAWENARPARSALKAPGRRIPPRRGIRPTTAFATTSAPAALPTAQRALPTVCSE